MASSKSYMIPAPTEERKMSEFRWIKDLICENASSMGLKSGEYGGKYSKRTPVHWYLRRGSKRRIEFHTIGIKKLLDTGNVVNSCVVHYQYAKRAWKG
jgi:hypothetical protein